MKSELNKIPDNINIITFADRIIGKMLTRPALYGQLLDEIALTANNDDLRALMTAIDSNYPSLQQRYDMGERGEVESPLTYIREETLFNLGPALGKRLR
jgi:hypothetical protein